VKFHKHLFLALPILVLLGAFTLPICAQSPDQSLPTPVLTNEINGGIPALDLGDARLTRHFYAFAGTPGDLLITMDSKNLNGDIDVFTAITFRPLMKTTLYANSRSAEITKGLYLRTRQILILRVEGRSPNDEEGAYHVRFGGTFAPFSGGIPVAENSEPKLDTSAPNRDGRRLSSVGATIAQPVLEKPAVPAVIEQPKETTGNEKAAAEKEKSNPTTTAKPKPPRSSTARNSRGRPRPSRPKPAPAATGTGETSEPKTEENKKEVGAAGAEKSGATEPSKSETKAQEMPITGPHLIIESKDGTKIDRPMSTVRRVVVEGGTIVVVLKTGRIERIPMSGVLRMAIEP
jgi:hypothetical protein